MEMLRLKREGRRRPRAWRSSSTLARFGAVFASRAGNADLETLSFLFGDPYAVTWAEVVTIGALGVAVVAWMRLAGRALFAVVTDEDWSRVAGLPVGPLSVALAALTAGVIIAGMRVSGSLLIAARLVSGRVGAADRTLSGTSGSPWQIGAVVRVGLTLARPPISRRRSIVFVARRCLDGAPRSHGTASLSYAHDGVLSSGVEVGDLRSRYTRTRRRPWTSSRTGMPLALPTRRGRTNLPQISAYRNLPS